MTEPRQPRGYVGKRARLNWDPITAEHVPSKHKGARAVEAKAEPPSKPAIDLTVRARITALETALADRDREIARLWKAQGWLSIKTAPKDGRRIMVYRRIDPWDVIGIAHWDGAKGIYGWIARGVQDPPGELGLGAPTHWRPLPGPPPARATTEDPGQ